MAGMGPPPKKNAQRRNAGVAMTRLPAEGRKGKAPAWPLTADIVTEARFEAAEAAVARLTDELADGRLTGARKGAAQRKLEGAQLEAAVLAKRIEGQRALELKLWRELWRTPQSVAWERMSWTRDVAQYVRWKVLAEMGDLDAAKEARQLSDRLGLTPLALLRLRWEIADSEADDRTTTGRRKFTPSTAAGDLEDPRSLFRVV
ncbi:hypothetical protein OG393_30985 [Streptomyces sp. NBC_01216]|uniref:hypothetical protein n=1 Tax=Streptomyces sp. NBC_01216 TaxID=2903778 RepID=UPI002E110ABB|nr:hypothetical protein OG393_30985 [Streptomyces sp. NBC_01216]